MQLIKLTQFVSYRVLPTHSHGKLIWINPAQIAYMSKCEVRIVTDHKVPVNERELATCTSITFCAMGHEADLTVMVCEKPQTIIALIRGV